MKRGKSADLWKRRPLEQADPKEEKWSSAKPASAVRLLTADELAARAAELGVPLAKG